VYVKLSVSGRSYSNTQQVGLETANFQDNVKVH